MICLFVMFRELLDSEFRHSATLTIGAGIQCLGFALLAMKVNSDNSVKGISKKSLGLYALVLTLRLTATTMKQGYLPVDRSGDWAYQAADVVSLVIVCQLLYRAFSERQGIYDEDHDTLQVLPMVAPCIFLAMFIHGDLNRSFFFDSVWTASLNVDTIALLPQLWMLAKKGGSVAALTSHFVAAIFVSRCCSFSFWWSGFYDLAPRDDGFNIAGWWVLGMHLFQVFISADFMYYYLRSFVEKKEMLLPSYEV
jgi:hypothetical protein